MIPALLISTCIGLPMNKGLQVILANMVRVDQECRNELTERMRSGKKDDMTSILARMGWIDRENTGRLGQIVQTYGWPSVTMVGKKAANDAWLLVQHADANPGFQRKCLDLMTPLLPRNEVDKRNYAYLTDRVLFAEGKLQRYGSQFMQDKEGKWNPRPLEDPANVDKRRAEMGMESLAEYRKLIEQVYGSKPPGP